MFERYTEPARRAVVASQRLAGELGHGAARPVHVLLGLLIESDRVGLALEEVGASFSQVAHEVLRRPLSPSRRASHLTKASEASCRLAVVEATNQGERFIRSGHLLLALLRQPEIDVVLTAADVSTTSLREVVSERLQGPELLWLSEENYTWV